MSFPSSVATPHEIYEHAQGIINKEAWKARKLQPYGSTSTSTSPNPHLDTLGLSPRGQRQGQGQGRANGLSSSARSPERGIGRKLVFGPDGVIEEAVDGPRRLTREAVGLVPGTKRIADNEDDNHGKDDRDEETRTEIDEDGDEDVEIPSLTTTSNTGSNAEDFPPVFQSPHLTQPELFTSAPGPSSRTSTLTGPSGSKSQFAVPALPDRALKGLPARGRMLGKTVSAPVGKLGGWGGMEVDGEEEEGVEDGFDVAEWAGSENF